jgi:hypothetical protein
VGNFINEDNTLTREATTVDDLRGFFTSELMVAMGLSPHAWPRRFLAPLVRLPTHRLAHLAATFERRLAQSGLPDAAHWLLFQFVESVDVRGAEHIPTEGPLLIAANHPAVYEALAIAAKVKRDDLKIVISGLPFTQTLPATAQHTIGVEPDNPGLAIRPMVQHLQAGGALLIFPGALLDPDPDLEPGAAQALEMWSPSLELLLHHVPETRLVVAITSGVLTGQSLHRPLTWLVKEPWNKRKAALIGQLIQQLAFGRNFGLSLRVTVGKPVLSADMNNGPYHTLPAIIEHARTVLATHMERH